MSSNNKPNLEKNEVPRSLAGHDAVVRRQNWILALLAILIALVSYWASTQVQGPVPEDPRPVAWITGDNMQVGYLNHVISIFRRLGYRIWARREEPPVWDVLWAHEYPFSPSFKLSTLKPHQKVNHFPGSGYITNKVNLATSGLTHIPKAFNVPKDKEEFLAYAAEHPEKLWVQKDNNHRGIRVLSITELNLDQKGTFVQEYIQNPLLIDGKKFDLGLYVVMTSINPLRVYVFDNEVLLRFCALPYYPFNVSNLNSYVVDDVYTPVWQIPTLAKYYTELNTNMKMALNAYIKNSLDKDPNTVWQQIEESIKTIYYRKEEQMWKIAGAYPSTRNFFELVRFDFTLDEDLNVYLMEANMSPNLASAKYPPNALIYEQVIHSLFSLVGVKDHVQLRGWNERPSDVWNMMVQEKDLSILPEICASDQCDSRNSSSCEEEHCDICQHCLTEPFKTILKDACVEEYSRWHFKRLIPSTSVESPVTLGQNNYLQDKWFIGKCLDDSQWCN